MRKPDIRSIAIFAVIIMTVIALTGCGNFLDDYVELVTEHQAAPYIKPPTEQIVVSDYDEFFLMLLELITQHETNLQLQYYPHEGEDVQAEVQRAANEVMNEHPIGAYAVANITAEATRVVSYFEVDIEIEFKRTKEQLDSIINVSTLRYFMTQLLNVMSEHREEAVIHTNLQMTEDEIAQFVIETYYQNPRRIVMLPFVAVEIFPEEGINRIYEIQFGYTTESPIMLQRYSETLALYIRQDAALAVGDTDAEILLSLVRNLMESTAFDEGAARRIPEHGPQNFAATAFGALVHRSAVGEGFAMAFKALCDELGFVNHVVLGLYEDIVHAWNIVSIDGYYYHIDVAMCVSNGIETAFLKTDEDFEEKYTWDRDNTVRCEGVLTLIDIIGFEEPDDPDDPEDPENTDDPENTEEPENTENQNGESNDNEEEDQ